MIASILATATEASKAAGKISNLDIVIIAVYLIAITAIGIKVGYRKKASSDQYFLAGKSLG